MWEPNTDIGDSLVCWNLIEDEELICREKSVGEEEKVVLSEILVWLAGSAARIFRQLASTCIFRVVSSFPLINSIE
jgi:hypothetical protein